MSLVIDANMKLFAERMNITSSRMIQDYGLKSVDEIIEAEAAQGNSQAVKFAQEMYNSPVQYNFHNYTYHNKDSTNHYSFHM